MKTKTDKIKNSVEYDISLNKLTIIDQTKLPNKLVYKELKTLDDVWKAIRNMEVRGAPAIGLLASYGLVMCANGLNTDDWFYFIAQLKSANEYFRTSRPTAKNLNGSLDAMLQVLKDNRQSDVAELKKFLYYEAERQQHQLAAICKNIGDEGVKLLNDGDAVITYCNAGSLAAGVPYGTALAPIYTAVEAGLEVSVFACETRPVLQGARLTAYELNKNDIDVTVICDNMVGAIMRERKISAVFVGADFVAQNGDVVNKIGTYSLAVLAKAHNIPFYVCAPTTSIDAQIKSGADILIENRSTEEVRSQWFKSYIVPKTVDIWNPSFDITPYDLITGIITENGLIQAPYKFE